MRDQKLHGSPHRRANEQRPDDAAVQHDVGRHPIFTIGHSTRTLAELISLLHSQHITLLLDIRKLPGSNAYPHFNRDTLSPALAAAGIEYRWAEALTGRRPVSRTVPPATNAWWRNRSFHNYADYALGREFAAALDETCCVAGRGDRVVLMCAEAVWWRCHRRIIADHLLARGECVVHIMGEGKVVDAKLSEGARVGPGGVVTYPA